MTTSRFARTPAGVLAVLALIAAVAGCGSDDDGDDGGGESYGVTSRDDACEVEVTTVPAGNVTFEVANEGSDVTEVYVYGKDGSDFSKIIGEVENIGPGTSRDFSVDLETGDYEVACKPGMVGDGIRSPLTVVEKSAAPTTDA